MGEHLTKHGDGVRDISFSVEDLDAIMERARQRGCKIVDDIWEESDEYGTVSFKFSFTPSLIFFLFFLFFLSFLFFGGR